MNTFLSYVRTSCVFLIIISMSILADTVYNIKMFYINKYESKVIQESITKSSPKQEEEGKIKEAYASVFNPKKHDYVKFMKVYATHSSEKYGIPVNYMIAQSALETGWGRKEIIKRNGKTSYNLFGIKAHNWNGESVKIRTTEYVNGIRISRVEKFRVYNSYTESFNDFAKLIKENPRYRRVTKNLSSPHKYANAIQKSGYATDPHYATKLVGVINKIAYK
jgi:flagellar protein FlgJ